MQDTRVNKKLPEEPQARPGLRPGYAARVRGLLGSFSLVLEKLLENQHAPIKTSGRKKLEEEWAETASTMAISVSLMWRPKFHPPIPWSW
uniref:Uncharacterized protein n=1 Tax=Bos indicus x Bos taurus TaxID=30522 RepID=A0A4W2IB39_BOBOX